MRLAVFESGNGPRPFRELGYNLMLPILDYSVPTPAERLFIFGFFVFFDLETFCHFHIRQVEQPWHSRLRHESSVMSW